MQKNRQIHKSFNGSYHERKRACECTMYIYIYRTPSETVFTTYMQFVHFKIYWKVHNINYNDRII